MSQLDAYFQFPICMMQGVSRTPDMAERTEFFTAVINRTVWFIADELERRYDNAEDNMPEERVADLEERHDMYSSEPDFWFYVASDVLKLSKRVTQQQALQAVRSTAGKLERGKKQTRIRMDIIHDVWAGDIDWVDFAVLVAVNACCNTKAAAVRVYRSQLAAMAIGYGGVSQVPDGVEPWPDSQIRYRMQKLERRGFLVQQTLNRRHTYVSNSMSHYQLASWLAKKQADKYRRRTKVPTATDKAALLQVATESLIGATAASEISMYKGIDAKARQRLEQVTREQWARNMERRWQN